MGMIIAGEGGTEPTVNSVGSSLNVSPMPLGRSYSAQALTNTIGAALAGNSTVWAMRFSPTAGSRVAVVNKLRVRYTTITAFTTPLTQNRSLILSTFSAAACAGGQAMAPLPRKSSWSASYFTTGLGGDARCSTTGTLTSAGVSFASTGLKRQGLVHVGSAGGSVDWTWGEPGVEPVYILAAGEGLAIRNDVAFDAAGTWQLFIDCEWTEHDSDPFG